MIEVIMLVISDGPGVGFFIKFSKGKYLVGKCPTNAEAVHRKNRLIEIGLRPDTIFLHPDNDHEIASKYGCSVLGSWIGSEEFIKKKRTYKNTA